MFYLSLCAPTAAAVSSLLSARACRQLTRAALISIFFSGSGAPASRRHAVNWPEIWRFHSGMAGAVASMASSMPEGVDDDVPSPGLQLAQFAAGCFWGVELAFQRVPGVSVTEVGYSQGHLRNPTYHDVCSGTTNHAEIVRLQYDPNECNYDTLLDVFWARHDPTTPNRQGNDVGTQYRSGIYYYTPEQEKAARESLMMKQETLERKIVTEILPAKKFYRAEEYHQQYLARGRSGLKQSAEKRCTDPIRCYG